MKISLLAALALLPFTANAGILFDNGLPNSLGGNDMGDAIQADDFILAVTSDLTSIRYWTLEASGAYLGSITWSIYSDSAGQPGSVVATGNTSSLTSSVVGTALGLNLVQNDFNITVNGLSAGRYWLGLHDGNSTDIDFQDYYWAWTDMTALNSSTSLGRELDLPGGTTWDSNDQEHAFNVSGNASVTSGVPEPSTMILFSAGIVGILAGRFRPVRGGRK